MLQKNTTKSWEKNENENGNENEYGSEAPLIGTTAWQEGKCPNGFVPIAKLRYRDDLIFWLLFDQAKCCKRIQQKSGEKNENGNVNEKENEYGRDDDLKRFRLFNQAKKTFEFQQFAPIE
jgi:hypothetical protein